jgi:phage FluMu protein Com
VAQEQKIKTVNIKCAHCGHSFESGIGIADVRTFQVAILSGHKQRCPKCSQVNLCNKENMSYILE